MRAWTLVLLGDFLFYAAVAILTLLALSPARGQTVRVDGATGVAVRIGNETNWLVTCQHGDVRVGEVFTIADERGAQTRGTVVAIGDDGADCALIRTEQSAVKFVELGDVEPSIGEQVTLCGYTMGGPLQCKVGHVTGYGGQVGEARGYTNYGDSGGPILNTSGKLVGVLSGNPGGPIVYCRLVCIRRMIDRVRPGWVIGRQPRPQLPPAYQQTQQPGQPSIYQPPVASQPSQPSPPTYVESQPGPVPTSDGTRDPLPDDLDNRYVTREEFERVQQEIGTDYLELSDKTDALETGKQDAGQYQLEGNYALKSELPNLGEYAKVVDVEPLAEKVADEKLAPIKTELGQTDEQATTIATKVADEKVSPLSEKIRQVVVTLGNFATKTEVKNETSTIRNTFVELIQKHQPGVLAGMSYGKLAVGALGLSGPIAFGIVAAGGLAGWLIGRKKQNVSATGTGSGGAGSQTF